jgi:chemotaxis protein methyltransferase CheR
LPGFSAYRDYLENSPDEWKVLDSLCHITISSFYRDRDVFDTLRIDILPRLAKAAVKDKSTVLRCWSAGCCSGEEPYSVNILWKLSVLPEIGEDLSLHITATERESYLLERSKEAVYPESSLKDLPGEFFSQAFEPYNNNYRLKKVFKEGVEFVQQDIRTTIPDDEFDVIFCRNLVFTYFTEELQRDILMKIIERLKPGGFLVIGAHEVLPWDSFPLHQYGNNPRIYQKDAVEK